MITIENTIFLETILKKITHTSGNLILLSVVLLFSANSTVYAAGDAVAGKEKSALCQGCHGEVGISAAPNFPHLAGQYAGYIRKQIVDFQKELRKDDTMSGMAATITEKQDLEDIAAYFAAQKGMQGEKAAESKSGENKSGKNVYLNGNSDTALYGCVNCHGEDGKGKSPNNSVFPVIGGQQKDYLVKQLNDFRSGSRANDPAGMMGDIAKKMTDAEIEAVSAYLTGL